MIIGNYLWHKCRRLQCVGKAYICRYDLDHHKYSHHHHHEYDNENYCRLMLMLNAWNYPHRCIISIINTSIIATAITVNLSSISLSWFRIQRLHGQPLGRPQMWKNHGNISRMHCMSIMMTISNIQSNQAKKLQSKSRFCTVM